MMACQNNLGIIGSLLIFNAEGVTMEQLYVQITESTYDTQQKLLLIAMLLNDIPPTDEHLGYFFDHLCPYVHNELIKRATFRLNR